MTTCGGDGFRARDEMPSAEGFGIYASPSPLFAKLTKLQNRIAKPLDRFFFLLFCKYMNAKPICQTVGGALRSHLLKLIVPLSSINTHCGR